jgi:Spy/CpxP family protein refolding chaperone
MRTIPGLILAACLAGGAGLALSNDGPMHGPPDPQKMVQHLKEKLNLSDAQTQQITEIMKAHADKMHALMEEQHNQIMGVLSQEQQAKFKQLHEEHRHWHHGEDGTPPPPPAN